MIFQVFHDFQSLWDGDNHNTKFSFVEVYCRIYCWKSCDCISDNKFPQMKIFENSYRLILAFPSHILLFLDAFTGPIKPLLLLVVIEQLQLLL